MSKQRDLLIEILRNPPRMAELSVAEWDTLLRSARHAGVLSRLAVTAESLDLTNKIPPAVRPHLEASRIVAARQDVLIRWEVDRIETALAGVDTNLVLLKGAAYLMADLQPAIGRIYNDTDILVDRDKLDAVEEALKAHGWEVHEDNPYHEAYFRRWLHELPPMQHQQRKSVIDVHHTILPRTDTLRLEPQALLDTAVPLEGLRWKVLAPVDMVLHSAAHLFRNGDFTQGLRDLLDLDGLLREFGNDDAFWEALVDRADSLDLRRPFYCGIHYAQVYFETPVPDEVLRRIASWRPIKPAIALLDRLVDSALVPRRLDQVDLCRELAVSMLAHWPVPRLRAMASGLFWIKRLPWVESRNGVRRQDNN